MKLLKILPILTLPFLTACGHADTEQVGQVNQALTQTVTALDLPSNVSADVSASDCENSPGFSSVIRYPG